MSQNSYLGPTFYFMSKNRKIHVCVGTAEMAPDHRSLTEGCSVNRAIPVMMWIFQYFKYRPEIWYIQSM